MKKASSKLISQLAYEGYTLGDEIEWGRASPKHHPTLVETFGSANWETRIRVLVRNIYLKRELFAYQYCAP